MKNDFNFGDDVVFGQIERGYSATKPKKRGRFQYNGVVSGWLSRGQIIVTVTLNGVKTDYVFSQRKSGNYIVVGDADETSKWFGQSLRLK
jgi:hypothetical protein